jgi:hypothetical protein
MKIGEKKDIDLLAKIMGISGLRGQYYESDNQKQERKQDYDKEAFQRIGQGYSKA